MERRVGRKEVVVRRDSVKISLPLPRGGECRQCGGELVYLSIRNTPDGISYSYFCRKCKLVGEEVYDLVHSGDKFHGKKQSLVAAENFFGVQTAKAKQTPRTKAVCKYSAAKQ